MRSGYGLAYASPMALRASLFLPKDESRNPLAMLFSPPSRMTPMERFLIVAISRGAEPDLILEASSPVRCAPCLGQTHREQRALTIHGLRIAPYKV